MLALKEADSQGDLGWSQTLGPSQVIEESDEATMWRQLFALMAVKEREAALKLAGVLFLVLDRSLFEISEHLEVLAGHWISH